MEILRVSGLTLRKENEYVLKNINFSQQRWQKIAIAGETGSGKSTLLKIIAGYIQAAEGDVTFEGERVLGPDEQLVPGQHGIAYLSQHFELRNNYKVSEVLEMANKMSDEQAQTIFDVCEISHLLKRKTSQLSGGEKQRIATARLLITSPKLLLLDEPFSNLDMIHKNTLKSVINDIGERLKITCILVSHDPLDTLSWADEILVMRNGKVVQQASPHNIYNQPGDEYVAGLFGDYNLLSTAQAKVFAELPGFILNGKSIMFRPENVRIADDQSLAIEAKVESVVYYGSYYEIDALIAGDTINIKALEANVLKGDIIKVAVDTDKVCYV